MGQRNHHRPVAECITYALLQTSGAEKARDRQLPDEDLLLGLEVVQLGVEPVSAVGDRCRWRLQVACARRVATGKAAHQGRDVGEAPELFGALETRAHHPPVELLAGAAPAQAARIALDWGREMR